MKRIEIDCYKSIVIQHFFASIICYSYFYFPLRGESELQKWGGEPGEQNMKWQRTFGRRIQIRYNVLATFPFLRAPSIIYIFIRLF